MDTPLTPKALAGLAFRRRLFVALLVVLLTLVAAVPMGEILSEGGWTALKLVFFGLFVLLQMQVAFGFVGALIGWWSLRFGRNQVQLTSLPPARELPEQLPAVAIVMPVYNEDASRIFQGLRAMYESLEKQGRSDTFDFFVLSDTSDSNCWIEEEKAWFELCKQVDGFGRIFYRKRRVQLHNKSGNIADFCRRWGASYRYMIVLDADSVMTGESFVKLTTLMEQHPRVGIIQTSPRPILGESLFQRIEQFAACVYRPVFAAGANFWQLGEATFWGHNAIIRLKPFMQYCAMPELPEIGPLGRRILSHDTIEAALIRKAGYQVWQAYDLEGSYEESPPHLLASLQRDRRWCHGNLQHLWFLFGRRIKAVSRFNILNGIMAYASSPLWLQSLILGVLVAINSESTASTIRPGFWQPQVVSLLLYTYVLSLLLLPKILGASLLARSPRRLEQCGGRLKVTLGVCAETIHSILMAPILMLFYTRFVLATLSGTEVKWGRQDRSGVNGPSWATWLRTHAANTLFALVATALVVWLSPAKLLWLAPVLAGPLLAIPLSRITASVHFGPSARKRNWFLILEETNPPEELAKLEAHSSLPENTLLGSQDYASDYGLLQAVLDPYVNAIHVSLLRLRSESTSRTRNHMRALADRLLLDGPRALTPAEKRMLLWDVETMLALHQQLWGSPESHLHDWWQTAFRHYVESRALSIRRTISV